MSPLHQARRTPRTSPAPRRLACAALLLLTALAGLAPGAVRAGPAPGATEAWPPPAALPALPTPPPAARGEGGRLDPEAATRAYLDEVPAAARARSDAYFEGGYWLLLWSFLWGAAANLLLLATGLSARMRDLAERRARRAWLRTGLYAAQWVVATWLLTLPLTVYSGWVRERAYGLSTQGFGAFALDEVKGLGLGVVGGALALAVVYAIVRRAPRTWWAWGAGALVVLMAVAILVTPVFITPLFARSARLADARVSGPVLRLARASGVEAGDVWEVQESHQSTRVSANVSGLWGTLRIALNDNLLARCSLPEIEAVMAHEIGHYVLHHVLWLLVGFGLVIVAGFAAVAWAFERVRARWGRRWGVRGVEDPAGLPLGMILLSAWLFLMTPLVNSLIRGHEAEADLYGLQAARQPDGFARAALRLADYRKLEPGPLEEVVFYDHPSGRSRILAAMRWKAEHPETWPAR